MAATRDSPRWTWVSAGGIVGALLWIVLSAGFVVYVNEFSTYGKTYGTMAGVVVLILWLFLTSLTVLIGGELNAELERQAAQKTAAPAYQAPAVQAPQTAPPASEERAPQRW